MQEPSLPARELPRWPKGGDASHLSVGRKDPGRSDVLLNGPWPFLPSPWCNVLHARPHAGMAMRGPTGRRGLACNRAYPWRVCGWGVACLKWAPLLAGTTTAAVTSWNRKARSIDDPAFHGCLRACPAGVRCRQGRGHRQRDHRGGRTEGHEPYELRLGSGRGTDIGSLNRHRSERGWRGGFSVPAYCSGRLRFPGTIKLQDMGGRWL